MEKISRCMWWCNNCGFEKAANVLGDKFVDEIECDHCNKTIKLSVTSVFHGSKYGNLACPICHSGNTFSQPQGNTRTISKRSMGFCIDCGYMKHATEFIARPDKTMHIWNEE